MVARVPLTPKTVFCVECSCFSEATGRCECGSIALLNVHRMMNRNSPGETLVSLMRDIEERNENTALAGSAT